jgi:hypothetical protein
LEKQKTVSAYEKISLRLLACIALSFAVLCYTSRKKIETPSPKTGIQYPEKYLDERI